MMIERSLGLCRRGAIQYARSRGLLVSFLPRPPLPRSSALMILAPPHRSYAATKRLIDTVSSSGVVIDPYLSYYSGDKSPRSIFSLEGLRERWRGVKSKLSSGVSFGHIKRHHKGFEVRAFPKEAQSLFITFHEAYEKGDLSSLAAVTTDDFYVNLKGQIKMKGNRTKRKVLRFLSFTAPTIVVHGRHIYSGPKGQQTGFGQVTCVLTSRREEYDVDGKGNRVKEGGRGPSSPLLFENESIVVFEVAFNDSKARWRIASIVEQERNTKVAAGQMMSSSGGTEPVAL